MPRDALGIQAERPEVVGENYPLRSFFISLKRSQQFYVGWVVGQNKRLQTNLHYFHYHVKIAY